MKRVAAVVLALAVLAVFSTTALAQQPVEYNVTVTGEIVKGAPTDHFLTFLTPVQVPEAILPAGTYSFTLQGSSTVRVSSADRAQVFAMFFTTPVTRPDAGDDYQVTLNLSEDRGPRRVSKLFLPNRSIGLEFHYPKGDLPGER